MDTIKLDISNVRCVREAHIELPFDNGIYTLVGTNGCGKSTIMSCLSQLVMTRNNSLNDGFTSLSSVRFSIDTRQMQSQWTGRDWQKTGDILRFNGLYEGSLFYGTRFQDSTRIERKINNKEIHENEIAEADDYVKDRLSFILHGDLLHYRSLKRIKNRDIASIHGIKNLPYFDNVDGRLISQYRMSSGECLLISLMHFLYNSIVRRSLPKDQKVIVLIDELELALHPIAVLRLVDYIKELVEKHENLVVFLTTHSPEVIKTMRPMDLFKVVNLNGVVSLEQNCYPSYLIRDLYSYVAPDFLFLVEDELSQLVVNRVLSENNLRFGKLIHCVPVGGWRNVLELHKELYSKKVLGNATSLLSILDGDVKNELNSEQNKLPHVFLPIPSVEKFLYSTIKERTNLDLRRRLNDKYFIVDSLDSIVSDYVGGTLSGKSDNDKNFYKFLCKRLSEMGTPETVFVSGLCDEILSTVDMRDFIESIVKVLEK